MDLRSEWMPQCYLWHNILSERGKQNKEVKNAVPQWPSLHQSVRSSCPGLFFFFHSLGMFALLCFFFPTPPCVCLPLVRSAELDSAFPLGLANSQLLFVFVAPCERKQPRATREQLLTNWWNVDFNWEWKRHGCNLLSSPPGKPAGVAFSRCRKLSPKPRYTVIIVDSQWTSGFVFQAPSV